MVAFRKAEKRRAKLKLALIGPGGSGKTYTALTLARTLGKRIAVIDSERSRSELYAGTVADFDVCPLTRYSPDDYIEALRAAHEYDVVVVDSLSHAWMGAGGILDQADARGGKFDAWKTLTPQHHRLVDALLAFPGHLIATMRVKVEYVVEKDERGRSVPRKVGLAPVQKDGMEYEFDLIGELDGESTMTVTKSRCPALTNAVLRKPGEEVARKLLDWLADGTATATAPPPAEKSGPNVVAANGVVVDAIEGEYDRLGVKGKKARSEETRKILGRRPTSSADLDELLAVLRELPTPDEAPAADASEAA